MWTQASLSQGKSNPKLGVAAKGVTGEAAGHLDGKNCGVNQLSSHTARASLWYKYFGINMKASIQMDLFELQALLYFFLFFFNIGVFYSMGPVISQ